MSKTKTEFWEKYKDPRWQKVKSYIQQRANFTCELCGATDRTLHVHHGYYEKDLEPWEYGEETLWCLCELCHEATTDTMRDIRLRISRIHPNKLYEFFCVIANDESWDNERCQKILDERIARLMAEFKKKRAKENAALETLTQPNH